ncbi:MAG: hypothetical protein AAF485_05475 [Chloroflexota bacterium]
MFTLSDLLNQLQGVEQDTILLGLFLTATIILVSRDWRALILALLAQYILLGIALSRLVAPEIATLKVMIGAFICPILFLSARQVTVRLPIIATYNTERSGQSKWQRGLRHTWLMLRRVLTGEKRYYGPTSVNRTFRLLLAAFLIIIAFNLPQVALVPAASFVISTMLYWLILAGLATLIITEDPLKSGIGLLTIFAGFDLVYTTVEESLLLLGLWGAVTLLVALAVGYLTVSKGPNPEGER